MEPANSNNIKLNFLQSSQIRQQDIIPIIKEYFPKLIPQHINHQSQLSNQEIINKFHQILQLHDEIKRLIENIESNVAGDQREKIILDQQVTTVNKKITRAALARRHEKIQQQIKKDQIFVRLTPRSQSCIQFMLCNRNFPRMQCKLSCNQHLEYLIIYLTNKWIRGKVGFKILLYHDNSFMKSVPVSQKDEALKKPIDTNLMFTDLMACYGIHQNGSLNLNYEIVEIKKKQPKHKEKGDHMNQTTINQQIVLPQTVSPLKLSKQKPKSTFLNEPNSLISQNNKKQQKQYLSPFKLPNHQSFFNHKEDYRDGSMFNKNSNGFGNNDESFFGSLGFNFNFGLMAGKKDEQMLSINSINYTEYNNIQQMKKIQQKVSKQSTLRHNQVEQSIKNEPFDSKKDSSQKLNNSQSMEAEIQKFCENQDRQAMKQENSSDDLKINKIKTLIEHIEKQKQGKEGVTKNQDSKINRMKEVKTINIIKKKAIN